MPETNSSVSEFILHTHFIYKTTQEVQVQKDIICIDTDVQYTWLQGSNSLWKVNVLSRVLISFSELLMRFFIKMQRKLLRNFFPKVSMKLYIHII